MPENNATAPYPPVFNPYHHLFFSNGYAYIPSPNDPFPPISPPRLAIFLPNGTTQDVGSPSVVGQRPGELGAGPRASIDAYWFNVYGAYLGCNNSGPAECSVTISGFSWDHTVQQEILFTQQAFKIPPCPSFLDCHLTSIEFPSLFRGLSGLQILATLTGSDSPIVFYMDNLSMSWYNNTCAAGLIRQMSRKK